MDQWNRTKSKGPLPRKPENYFKENVLKVKPLSNPAADCIKKIREVRWEQMRKEKTTQWKITSRGLVV